MTTGERSPPQLRVPTRGQLDHPVARAFLEALLARDRQGAVAVALGALESMSVQEVYVAVVQEALYEVGRLWETSRISVAAEHIASAIAQTVVVRLHEHLPREAAARGLVLVAGVEGEQHQLGGLIVSDALEAEGWDVRFLGSDVPSGDVLDLAAELRPRILGLSCMMLQNLPRVALLVDGVRARLGESTRVVVGGGAFRHDPDAAARLCADAWAPDVRGAVEVVHGLFPGAAALRRPLAAPAGPT